MIKLSKIARILCEYYDVSEKVMFSKSRKREIITKRQVFHFLAKKLTKHNLSEIGRYYVDNVFDHSTVIHSVKTVQNLFDTDKSYRIDVIYLEQVLNNSREYINFKLNLLEQKKFDLKRKIDKIQTNNEFNRLLIEYLNIN